MRFLKDLQPFRRDALAFFLQRGSDPSKSLERIDIGPRPMWLVTRPEIVKDLLKSNEEEIGKGTMIRKLRPILGCSSLTLNGQEHRTRREALHQTFSRGGALRFVPEMAAVIRRQAAALASTDAEFDANAITSLLTLRMICIVMFGHNVLTSGDEQALIHAVGLVESDVERELFQLFPALPWTAWARKKRRAEANLALNTVVSRVRSRTAASSSLMSALSKMNLPDTAVRDEIVTMLIAGHHTTGAAASWLLYFLATEPDLANKISEEAQTVVGPEGEIQGSELSKAPLSNALVREVLRLYPSAHWFSREAQKDVVVEDQKIRKGETIIICPWLFHRHSRFWSDPDTFRTDRSYATPAYIPFGAGPRACVGMGIAILELQLLALEIASAFEVQVTSAVPAPSPTSSITLVPPPLRLKLSLRDSHSIATPHLGERRAS